MEVGAGWVDGGKGEIIGMTIKHKNFKKQCNKI